MGTKTEEGRARTESVATAVVQQKTKEQKAKAAMSSSKGKKKKWSKGKVKEKSNMMVLFDKNTFEKLNNEVPKYKMITPSILVDRLRISGSLARVAIKLL